MRYAIVGGGITGLSLGYFLAKDGHKVSIFEKEDRLGGLAATFHFEGTEIERFYHHFFSSDSELTGLIAELGMENDLVWARSSMGFYAGGKIYPFTSPFDLLAFSAIPFISRLRLGLLTFKSRMIRDWSRLAGKRPRMADQ
jgi:protoporphyrinogen oxidase